MGVRVGAILSLSPRGTPKDSPAVCWSGCRLGGYGPFKFIMAAAPGNCFDGSEGRGLSSSHATSVPANGWLRTCSLRRQVCIPGHSSSVPASLRHGKATAPALDVIRAHQALGKGKGEQSARESDHPMALCVLTSALRSLSLTSPAITARVPTLLPSAQVIRLPRK